MVSNLAYQKKKYLLDTNTELKLFRILVELFGDQYYIFPQINYGHIFEPKKFLIKQWIFRSHIEKKSADFVLCDKLHVVPQLIIELDGGVHKTRKKKIRDYIINQIASNSNMPILHINTNLVDKDFVKSEVEKMLNLYKS
jgi:hypothetical protein